MTWIVDASVAAKWYLDDVGSAESVALRTSGRPIVAPDLLLLEVCNAIWKSVRRQQATKEQFRIARGTLSQQFSELVPSARLIDDAGRIAEALDHPIYDCCYLALAEQRQLQVITADSRFLTKAAGTVWSSSIKNLSQWASARP